MHLPGDADNRLSGVQALAYGDPNFDGTQELYGVYDIGVHFGGDYNDGNTAIASNTGDDRFTSAEAGSFDSNYNGGIPAIATFPNIEMRLRDQTGSAVLDPDNLINRATRAIKAAVPEIGVITDAALDPFTSHGHDGILRDGVIVNDEGVRSMRPFGDHPARPCIFEYIYFSRPDSIVEGRSVYEVRKAFGAQLARESHAEVDVVVPVPDSGVPAALGYSQFSGVPYELGIIRNHYVGRTFIEPQQTIRHFGVKIKLNAQREVLNGKRVIVVDDSIVRGTTSRKIIRMLRDAGAKEVHMRISSPATTGPCYYGIDTPTRTELIASSNSLEEIRRFIEADTLAYLSNEGMYDYFDGDRQGFCDACFSGNYPVHFEDEGHTRQLHLFEALQVDAGRIQEPLSGVTWALVPVALRYWTDIPATEMSVPVGLYSSMKSLW